MNLADDRSDPSEPDGTPPHPGMDWRVDPLTGKPAVVVESRQGRPNLPSHGCPFCPGGLEAPEGHYDTKWFPNRWPAMPAGRCEMVLYTPEHDLAFWQLGAAGARRVVELWRERTEVLGAREDVAYVLVFENRGREVGATIDHPHGQIYAYEEVPPVPLAELLDGVLDVQAVDPALVVCGHGDWLAWVPGAATWPFELMVAPRSGMTALTDDALDVDGLSMTLIDALARLDQLVEGPMPYMMWIHQRPTSEEVLPEQPMHLHVAPLLRAPGTPRFMASAELGGGVYFNPVDPIDAAGTLRALPGAPAAPEPEPFDADR
jgi:UDPglucose--hexose-1-phosphate uridylyltransferase